MCSIEKMENGTTYHIVVGGDVMENLKQEIAAYKTDIREKGYSDCAEDVLSVALQCLGMDLGEIIREAEEAGEDL